MHLSSDMAGNDAEKLLVEWYEQWLADDQMPAKMADGLHIRTYMHFVDKSVREVARTLTRPEG